MKNSGKHTRRHRRTVVSRSAQATIRLGQAIARILNVGDVVYLYGDLGSGKTTLTKGIARGLGIKTRVTSSSFVIATEYRGKIRLSHVDLYRLSGQDIENLPLDEYLAEDGVTVIEWSERLRLTRVQKQSGLHVHIAIRGQKNREFIIEDLRD
ncbi:MAG TPA: tRNA (adenosine(37)-N6)-threonylcarbamoyltransferase complex ATPase subunit type 1 TsaE [bacterium]